MYKGLFKFAISLLQGPKYIVRKPATSPEPHFEYALHSESKGLFVIITNKKFGYNYLLPRGDQWRTTDLAAYTRNTKQLEDTFRIKSGDLNVKWEDDLTSNKNDGRKFFDKFIDEIKPREGHPPYSFVFVVLMSHGHNNEIFLLSDTQDISCCLNGKGEHSLEGDCHGRNVHDHLIMPIQKQFPHIPKIFLIQACRGGRMDDYLAKGDNHDLFGSGPIPRSADTAVFYPVGREQLSFVDRNLGSYFLYEFCEAVSKLKERAQNSGKPSVEAASVHGWFDDVCREVRSVVANKYICEMQIAEVKQAESFWQPVLSTSLNKKLSFLKMMKSQEPNWGNPKVDQ